MFARIDCFVIVMSTPFDCLVQRVGVLPTFCTLNGLFDTESGIDLSEFFNILSVYTILFLTHQNSHNLLLNLENTCI